jgi:hypothetical protein
LRHQPRRGAFVVPFTATSLRSQNRAAMQQPYDFFFVTLAVVVSIMPIVDTVRFIPQKTVDKSFGSLGFDEGYKSPDSEIV